MKTISIITKEEETSIRTSLNTISNGVFNINNWAYFLEKAIPDDYSYTSTTGKVIDKQFLLCAIKGSTGKISTSVHDICDILNNKD